MLWRSNFCPPFSSGAGVTVESHIYCRGDSSFKNCHVQEVVLNWDGLKTRAHLLLLFLSLCGLDCTQFDRSCQCLKIGAEEDLILLKFYDTQ